MSPELRWNRYHIVPTRRGVGSIVEHVLVDKPDSRDLDALASQIEAETMGFIKDVERFLSEHKS